MKSLKIILFLFMVETSGISAQFIDMAKQKPLTCEDYKKLINDRIERDLKGNNFLLFEDKNLLQQYLMHFGDDTNFLQKIIDYDLTIDYIEIFSNGPLQRFCRSEISWEMVKFLLIHGANPSKQEPGTKLTALHLIALSPMFRSLAKLWETDENYRNKRLESLKLTIISGGNILLKTREGSAVLDNKTPLDLGDDIARGWPNSRTEFMKQIAQQRDNLFNTMIQNKNISLVPQNDEERKTWISRCHARDIHGNNLLYYALRCKNAPLARRLISLWPQLLKQPNFEGKAIIQTLPSESINCLLS